MARIRLILSYILDWIVVIAVAAVGGVFYVIDGFHRPFSLQDNAISYPLRSDIVSIGIVVLVALVAPLVIIAGLCVAHLVFKAYKKTSRTPSVRAVLWQINAGWLGLCTALAITLFITTGLKDMVGKPRPNLLATCNANLTDIPKYVVGGYGSTLDSESGPFVTSSICQQRDKKLLGDGFGAFPSGHSSFSSAGMVYLTLWLCARFSIAIPFLGYQAVSTANERRQFVSSAHKTQAAPPLWLSAICFAPIIVALFICSSRYADFHHAGFDIIAGMVIGTVFGWTGFRLYHLPIRRGHGMMAWASRPENQAFCSGSQRDQEQPDSQLQRPGDYELGVIQEANPPRVATGSSEQPILPHTSR